jgi:CRP-like cAMP-binding protein
VSGSCFAERLEHYLRLTDDERSALAQLEEQERRVRRGAVVQREHDRAHEMFVIRSGCMYSHVLLDDGSRQILRLHFPGDLVGTSGAAFVNATESVVAITDVTLCPFDRKALRQLFEGHPRIAALLFLIAQAERVSLTDRLASLGRTSARARVAALLLDTFDRLRAHDATIRNSFHLPLTQEEIGDATGLTAVHVNRMVRVLVEEGLIARANSTITILDEARLASIANYVNRYAALDTSWLPKAS